MGTTNDSLVTWTISPSGLGTIDQVGLYTAPAPISAQRTVTITATSQADPTQSASAVVTLSPTQCASSGYGYERAITIVHTKVPNTDQTSFPFLFKTTDPVFATTANGGHVASPNGYDLIFSADPNGLTRLDHELEEYNPATGQVIAWVRIPALSHGSDTVLYVFYGNPSITASQQNPAGVWDRNYKGVWHVADGTVLSLNDSTSNGNNATNNGATATAGQIDGGMQTNGNTYANVAASASFANLAEGNATFSAWINPAAGAAVGIMGKDTYCPGWTLGLNNYGSVEFLGAPCRDYFDVITPTQVTRNAWTFVTVTIAGKPATDQDPNKGQAATIYINGVPSVSKSGWFGAAYDDSTQALLLASAGPRYAALNGGSDEFRVSNVLRSADWIATEYNNQSSAATFYSLSQENAIAVVPAAVTLFASQTQQFAVPGPSACTPRSVTWAISPDNLGTISASGLYSSPAKIISQQTIAVTASDSTNGTPISSANVTLSPPISVKIAPASIPLYSGQQVQFTATVTNSSNTAVKWSMNPTTFGGLSSTGLYTAPYFYSFDTNIPQTITVTATSAADSTKSASAVMDLVILPSISINPTYPTLTDSQTQQFTATVSNLSSPAVVWSLIANNVGAAPQGTLSQSGQYQAPSVITSSRQMLVYATSQANPSVQGLAVVTLAPLYAVNVTPSLVTLSGGAKQQFRATVRDTSNQAVTWSISPAGVGTISSSGLYTAPATVGAQQAVTIAATGHADPTQTATATVILAPSQCMKTGYGYERTIVIDHTAVSNSDQLNFPFLIDVTDPALATTANGGHVSSSNGNDIIFSTDPNSFTTLV